LQFVSPLSGKFGECAGLGLFILKTGFGQQIYGQTVQKEGEIRLLVFGGSQNGCRKPSQALLCIRSAGHRSGWRTSR
jgi:hypothetical protein